MVPRAAADYVRQLKICNRSPKNKALSKGKKAVKKDGLVVKNQSKMKDVVGDIHAVRWIWVSLAHRSLLLLVAFSHCFFKYLQFVLLFAT